MTYDSSFLCNYSNVKYGPVIKCGIKGRPLFTDPLRHFDRAGPGREVRIHMLTLTRGCVLPRGSQSATAMDLAPAGNSPFTA